MANEIVPVAKQYEIVKTQLMDPNFLQSVKQALPNHISQDKMIRVVLTTLTKNPKLLECTGNSLMRSVLEAAQLGLMVDGILGEGYIVPFWNNKIGKLEATFMAGYKGIVKMARNSGKVNFIDAHCVYRGDEFDFAYGAKPFLTHKPAEMFDKERGDLWATYAVAGLDTGEVVFTVLFKADIDKVKDFVKARGKGRLTDAWINNESAMWEKTAILRVGKRLPLSAEVQKVITKGELDEQNLLDAIDVSDFAIADEEPEPPEEKKPALDKLTEKWEPTITMDATAERVPEEPKNEERPQTPPTPPTPPEPPWEEPVQKAAEAPEAAPAAKDDPPVPSETDDEAEARKGRISDEEDEAYLATIASITDRASRILSDKTVKDVTEAIFKNFTATGNDPLTIRSRAKREDMIKYLDAWLAKAEKGAKA